MNEKVRAKLKDIEVRLLAELMKNSRRSDRGLAQIIGTSQPTVGRTIERLEKEGVIQEYTVIPNFVKMGYGIMAVTIAKARVTLTPDQQEMAKKLVLENPQVIFVASAEGMGRNGVMISLHKDYSNYRDFITSLKSKSEGYMEEVDSMLISLESSMAVKPLSLANLAKHATLQEAKRNPV